MLNVVVVVAGGRRPSPAVLAAVPKADAVVCADSGVDHALEQGWAVDVAVGDFDSVSAEGLKQAESAGAEIRRHSENKNQTDLELAIRAACEMAPAEIHVIGIGGGRLDHAYGNLVLLANPAFAQVEINALDGNAAVTVVHEVRRISGAIGELASVFAVNGNAHGVTIQGMQYPLVDATLRAGSSLGLSNRLTAENASVSVDVGALLVIQPQRLSGAQVGNEDV